MSTRQGCAEAGIFAPPGGGTEATHDPVALPAPPRRIPSALGWEGHHRITTGSEGEVNVKLGMSRVGHPSRTVGRRAQCGPCVWGDGVDVYGPLPPLTPKRTPIGASWRGQRRHRLQGIRGGHRPLQHPHPPYTFPGGTHIHPGPAPIYIRGSTHTHLGFLEGVARVPCAPRFASSRCRERTIPKKIRPPPGGCGGR